MASILRVFGFLQYTWYVHGCPGLLRPIQSTPKYLEHRKQRYLNFFELHNPEVAPQLGQFIQSPPGEHTSRICDTHTCGSGLWFHRNNRHVLSSCPASCCSSWLTFDSSFNFLPTPPSALLFPRPFIRVEPFFELRRPGEFVDRWSTSPVLVPGYALVFE